MKVESIVAIKAHRNSGMFLWGLAAVSATAMLLLMPAAAYAVGPGGSVPADKRPVVTIENIPGKDVPRVILTAKAAERLGIETGKVSEQQVVNKQMVGGLLIPAMDTQKLQEKVVQSSPIESASFSFGRRKAPPLQPAMPGATSVKAGDVWVLVTLSQGELDKLAKDKPARLLPLATRDHFQSEILAQPSGIAPIEDMKRSMQRLYYVVPGKDHGLNLYDRVRVQLQVKGIEEKQKVVPYSAVYYDAQGTAWVYVNEKPLTYERRRIDVERIVDDLAVLSDGPPVGTPVVTVGAPMLHGAEIFKK